MAELASDGPALSMGLPCRRLTLPNGDCLTVALQGAQVLSWVASGTERLYLSPRSAADGRSAIRGGVPVCFPQFNQRGPLPKHGFARNAQWALAGAARLGAQTAELSLRLADSGATRAVWPHSFKTTLHLRLQPGQLQITLAVGNTGTESIAFTGALHTYLAVSNIADVVVDGLQGLPEWDAVFDRHARAAGALRFHGEFDRVYDVSATPLTLREGAKQLQIEQSASLENTVVWNPGAGKCAALQDMPADGYKKMLCVEAAQVMRPITLPAGAQWEGWQRLSVR